MDGKTYSISVRIKRTTVEYAFVLVPVNESVMAPDPLDATKPCLSAEKVFQVAKSMGTETTVPWAREGEQLIEVHPWQAPPTHA